MQTLHVLFHGGLLMHRTRAAALILLIPGLVVFLGGCAEKRPPAPAVVSETAPRPARGITTTGYAVQVGAFSILDNAVRLTRYLNSQGENAFYFRHESGLFKVRIGDFQTRQEALQKARHLVDQGLVDSYYIVSPEEYALARSRILGANLLRQEIVKTAMGFIGLPYQWGGESPEDGFDCSGLTMVSYKMNGLNIPRSSREQFQRGKAISKGRLQEGDLVFFSIKSGRKVSHVGLYKGGGEFIHAPGAGKTIRVDHLSNPYYASHYSGARTYF
jgi:cell wall-associated NlpC family hydrolase